MQQGIENKILSEFFGFLKYKVDHGGLTLDEGRALLRFFDSVPLSATAEDLAGFYGKSPVAVRSVIHRKLISKPKRRVSYDFKEFRKVAPDKWKK